MGVAPWAGRRVAVVGQEGVGHGVTRRIQSAGATLTVVGGESAGARSAPDVDGAEVVVVSLRDELAVEETFLDGVAPALGPGTVVVDLTPVSAEYAEEVTQRLAERKISRVEACVVGDDSMAEAGDLAVFAAGAEDDVAAAADVLALLTRRGHQYLGPMGRASALRVAISIVVGAQASALVEAVTFAEAAGLGREPLLSGIAECGSVWPAVDRQAQMMGAGRYHPARLPVGGVADDLRLAVETAARRNRQLPLTQAVGWQFAQAVAAGHGAADAAAVLQTMKRSTVELTLARGSGGNGCACGGH
ncbi:NAD(P)-binding domain-containing protein [Asanoa iriomotensis]|uniref:3-hydroxyisobutyrate dehydrogenase n=1 Tax=Asanoa iriomotensis TaxID=234613 RepID=A0ABQ4C0V0_9ACTN|nr:NAD(P)-binding domain-containing protein [Asanoa iriomotensis]GIF56407.1 3-hydroxyisobutyrate dehydrogenase [Asanoa iriomotensis]